MQCADDLWGWLAVTFPLPLRNFVFTLQLWWFIIAAASYYWLNPLYGENLRRAETFEPDWMLYGLARNLGLTIIVSAQSVSASSR